MPMLDIGADCCKPGLPNIGTKGATHRALEPLPDRALLVASAAIGHQPALSRELDIADVHLVHLFHRKSVHVDE